MKPSALKALAIGVISLVALAIPGTAAAQALTQTIQVLPPGGNGCPTLPVQGIVAHVREGSIHSFDVTVANPSYVAVLAQVGDKGVPFRYMTRFNHGGGSLRHHVDLDTTPIRGSIPVSLTLLSSPQGSPTCLSVISFSVSPTGQILAPGMISGSTDGKSATVSKPISQGTSTKGGTATTAGKTTQQGTTPTATSTTSKTAKSPVVGGFGATLKSLCAGNGALQLWFLLLAIYVVIAALTALARPPLAEKSMGLPLALILVPLVLLLGFWYLVPSCRGAGWIPAASIIVAIAGLLVAFRDQHPAVRIIPLPAAKPPVGGSAVNKSVLGTSTGPKPEQPKK